MSNKHWNTAETAKLNAYVRQGLSFSDIHAHFADLGAETIRKKLRVEGWYELADPVSGLICPKCDGGDFGVRDSRPTPGGIRRRRRCNDCGHRVTTLETIRETPIPQAKHHRLKRRLEGIAELVSVIMIDLSEEVDEINGAGNPKGE